MSVFRAASWALFAQYYSFILMFTASVILARYFISPAQLGLFSIAFAAISLIAFLQDFGVGRFINGERDLGAEKIRTAFTVSLIISWLIAAICVGLAWPLAAYYGNGQLVTIALVIASSYFLVPFAIVPQALRQRELDFKSSAMVDMGAATANAAVSLYLGWKGHGAMALAWGAFAQQAGRAIVAQWRAGWIAPWPPSIFGPRKLFEYGGTNTVLVACLQITTHAPELLIGRLFGPASVGFFARAAGLAMHLRLLLVGAVSGVFFPAFRKIRDAGEPLGPPYILVAGAFSAIMWPALAGLAVLAEPTINLIYGEKWIASAPLLFWLALAQMCFISVPLNADLPILLDKQKELVFRLLLDLAAALTLLAAAIPFGLEAIVASRLVHGLIWIVMFASFVQRISGFSWRDWLLVQSRSLAVTGLAIAPALILYRIADGPHEAGFLQIMASAGSGVILWLVGLWLLRHPAFTVMMENLGPLRERVARSASS